MTRASIVGLIVEALLIVLGLVAIIGGDTEPAAYCSAAWVLLALIYVTNLVWAAWRRRVLPDDGEVQEPALSLPRWLIALLGTSPVIAALVGLFNVLTGIGIPQELIDQLAVSYGAEQVSALTQVLQVAATAITILTAMLGWALLHLGYARHYERLDHLYGPALRFPATADPDLTDYVYFSLTVGTTFATSDAAVTSRRLRWTVAVHSVLAFFYNAIVLAIAFKLITG
ncbi:DUF1345 domain-containing protein [Actinomyces ruminicola]|uniref:Uncharacterized membrane protein n=1 Tax=Actinomyces ruminicola TaxID=332524 RepID=A0A1G9XNT8_9ACTO|nr:DUF1345 domain-containing protein [Actinomyces ruminicola]SDM98502.1 Uncharacterized membrane protein [Actinomyces ruminicola]